MKFWGGDSHIQVIKAACRVCALPYIRSRLRAAADDMQGTLYLFMGNPGQ